jgi:preprotein translocase subunit SecA
MLGLVKKIFGSKTDRDYKEVKPLLDQTLMTYESIKNLSNDDLRAKTSEFRQRIREYIAAEQNEIDKLLESIETRYDMDVEEKEGYKNSWLAGGNTITWDMVHYDVQLIGGIVLHQGKIAEMATGEGKTLVATLPVYLNALAGKGVHIVTVNDYLAKRDSEWMGVIVEFLGLTGGLH